MARTVFENRMVAHVWAQQNQPSGRSGNGNYWFRGDTIYSYAQPIGRIVRSASGDMVTLVTDRTWSITTSSHQISARSAGRGTAFTVPTLDDHTRNLAALVASYSQELEGMKRKRDLLDWRSSWVNTRLDTAIRYATAFGLTPPDDTFEADWQSVLDHHAQRNARNSDPKKVAARERANERRTTLKAEREARQREQALRDNMQEVAAWRAGERSYLPYGANCDAQGGALLRISGDKLQTSMGATVPLSHAIRVFHAAMQCRTAQTTWTRNGQQIKVGEFQIDHINADGSFKAGCHTINWGEIKNAARIVGLISD